MINFVLMEIGKKQSYIFKSNKLKENIGASMIIKFVTEELPKNELSKNNGKKIIEGGGKSLYSFDNKEIPKIKYVITLDSDTKLVLDTAKEFIFSVSGVAGVGYGLRLVAQQGVKFINAIWPGTGSAISAAIAGGGTNGIGKAAIAYYIDGKSIEDCKAKLDEEKANKGRSN